MQAPSVAGAEWPANSGAPILANNTEGKDDEGHWLLCVVVGSGEGLYVGPDRMCGDIFCMLHTYDGVSRSRTAVTGMVYNNASPQWPSNGNGNAFVLPVKHSNRDTNLVITVWDGSESMEEANPVGKVEINLKEYMENPKVRLADAADGLPPRKDFRVDLVPDLAEQQQGEVKLTLMLERADDAFPSKDAALNDLLGRLASARKYDRMQRIQNWSHDYPSQTAGKQGHAPSDYSLVALLTKDEPPMETSTADPSAPGGRDVKNGSESHGVGTEEQPVDGMVERLTENTAKLSSVPVRAQAELLARLKPLQFEDGGVIMAAGTQPKSIFFVRSGAVTVTVNGEEVSRIHAGQCLGEVGLLLGERRIADVRACGRTDLFELGETDLWMALDMFPGLYKELHSVAKMRYEHLQSRNEWGTDKANIRTTEGPLREFQMFLSNVSAQIPWNTYNIARQQSEPKAAKVHSSPGLGSISETSVDYDFMEIAEATRLVGPASATADQLSKRLELFEQKGAFGKRRMSKEGLQDGAILIPQGKNAYKKSLPHLVLSGNKSPHNGHGGFSNSPRSSGGINSPRSAGSPAGSPERRSIYSMSIDSNVSLGSYARPLRGEVLTVGSLEQARHQGGLGHIMSALSPKMQTGWDGLGSSEDTDSDSSWKERQSPPAGQGQSPVVKPHTTSSSIPIPSHVRPHLSSEIDGFKRSGSHGDLVAPAPHGAAVGPEGVASSLPARLMLPRPRSTSNLQGSENHQKSNRSIFKIRFRKVHDCYTAEELGCSARRKHTISLSGIAVQTTARDSDISAYFFVEGSHDVRLTRSEIVRAEKNDIHWPQPHHIELEDNALLDKSKLKFTFHQSRKVWSDRSVGFAMVDLADVLARPNLPIQHTYQIVKQRGKDGAGGDDDDSVHGFALEAHRLSTASAGTGDEGGPNTPKSGMSGVSAATVKSDLSVAPTAVEKLKQATLPRVSSLGEMFGRFTGFGGNSGEDENSNRKIRGTCTLTISSTVPVRLPFYMIIPPLSNTSNMNNITDHTGKVVCRVEYMGRSRCAWCTNVDPSEGFHFGFFEANEGAPKEPCCNACSIKGWSECVALWDADMQVRLGTICTDVAPRKHSRARLSDHDNTHFASVRAAATTRPDISTGVRFKVVVTFHELVVRTTGSVIQGKSCSSSYQVLERVSETRLHKTGSDPRQKHSEKAELSVIAELTRGSNTENTTLIVQPGKDAGRALLWAVGINEACRLRPKAIHDGTMLRDKFDRDYEEIPIDKYSISKPLDDQGTSSDRPSSAGSAGRDTGEKRK